MDLVVPLEIVEAAIAIAVFVAFFLGIAFTLFFVYFTQVLDRKNFKRYLGDLPEKEKFEYLEKLIELEDQVEYLARRSNTKVFGRMYNGLVRFNSYIKQKWIQT
jgi:hypothetical protein